MVMVGLLFFFSSRRRHTRWNCDWSSDVCSSDLGGGPIGLEMAQAHARLGARVTVLEAAGILAKDDPELAVLLRDRLLDEGIAIREQAAIARIERAADGIAVILGGTVG